MFQTRDCLAKWLAATIVLPATFLGVLMLSGCERKEKIIDVETPGGEVEVERDKDTGEVDVEVNENN